MFEYSLESGSHANVSLNKTFLYNSQSTVNDDVIVMINEDYEREVNHLTNA